MSQKQRLLLSAEEKRFTPGILPRVLHSGYCCATASSIGCATSTTRKSSTSRYTCMLLQRRMLSGLVGKQQAETCGVHSPLFGMLGQHNPMSCKLLAISWLSSCSITASSTWHPLVSHQLHKAWVATANVAPEGPVSACLRQSQRR